MSNDRTDNQSSEPSLLLSIYDRLAALGRARRKSAYSMALQSKPLTLPPVDKATKQHKVNAKNKSD